MYQYTAQQEISEMKITEIDNSLNDRLRNNKKANQALDTVNGFFDDDMLFDSDHKATKWYDLSLATNISGLNWAKNEVSDYKKAIDDLNSDYKSGKITQDDYNSKITELTEGYDNAVLSVKKYKDSLINLYSTAMNEELEALNEVIEAQKKALQSKKDYYDYDKTISEKNKNIQALQNQIDALQNVSTSEARAELARLQEQLSEANEDLDDTINEHLYNLQVEGLDELKDTLSDLYDKNIENFKISLDTQEKLINEQKGIVDTMSSFVGNALSEISKAYGLNLNTSDVNWLKLGGAATGGVIASKGRITEDGIMQLTAGETVLTDKFTNILPESVIAMESFNQIMDKKFVHPDTPTFEGVNNMNNHNNVEIHYDNLINIEGNADATVITDLKKFSNEIVNKTISEISKDLRRSGIKPKH